MTAIHAMNEARRLGIVLTAREGRLAYKAPANALTETLRSALAEHKAEILRLLEAGDGATGSPASAGPAAESWEPRPLPWRLVVARWPIPRRERWGRMANRFEVEDGLVWDEAEERAFAEVLAEGALPQFEDQGSGILREARPDCGASQTPISLPPFIDRGSQ
jgi:TubC N-terminal docking domain